jgi:hypothetical protein
MYFSIVPMFMFSGKISDCIPVTIVSPFRQMLILVHLSIEQNQYFSHSRLRNRRFDFFFLAFIRDLTFKILITVEYLGEVFSMIPLILNYL